MSDDVRYEIQPVDPDEITNTEIYLKMAELFPFSEGDENWKDKQDCATVILLTTPNLVTQKAYTYTEVAEYFGIHPNTLANKRRRWRATGIWMQIEAQISAEVQVRNSNANLQLLAFRPQLLESLQDVVKNGRSDRNRVSASEILLAEMEKIPQPKVEPYGQGYADRIKGANDSQSG